MTIGEIGWQRGGSAGSASGTYNGFKLYMGVAAGSELTDTFEANYAPGTKTMVYSTPVQTMSAAADGWMMITLDTPYEYDGTENLIVELQWAGGANMFYTYMWDTGASRGLMNKTDISNPTGTLSNLMSELMFEPAYALEANTFAAIKALWSN